MKLTVEDDIVVDERFDTHGDLVERFREYERAQGRVPPAFMWEQLLVALATFVAGYLGEKALDGLWDWVRPKRETTIDPVKILTDLASAGHPVHIVLETTAEAEILRQLREQLPGVEITIETSPDAE